MPACIPVCSFITVHNVVDCRFFLCILERDFRQLVAVELIFFAIVD